MNPFSKLKARFFKAAAPLSKPTQLAPSSAPTAPEDSASQRPLPPASPHKNLRIPENVDVILTKPYAFNGMAIQNDGSLKLSVRATVRIGHHFHSGKGCVIRTSDHDFARGYPMVHGALAGYQSADVTIGDYVWLGNEVLVMKGVTIGDGAIIQARSVVVSDIPPLAIAGGHPCRPFRYRDPEEFAFFKSLGLGALSRDAVERNRDEFERRLAEFRATRPPPTSS